ncbi:MAG TPA: hypothetical protein VM260_22010 [Pirellula sp.]|nr:hypothetical protein [Pirellula sp.]
MHGFRHSSRMLILVENVPAAFHPTIETAVQISGDQSEGASNHKRRANYTQVESSRGLSYRDELDDGARWA